MILSELGMQRDIHQAAVSVRSRLRHTTDRFRVQHPIAHDANPARPLSDKHAPIRKKYQAPGVHKPFGHHCDSNLMLLRRIKHEWAGAQRRHRDADGLLGLG